MKGLYLWWKQDIILQIITILSLVSCCFIPFDQNYFSYFDWKTLWLLFSLMAIVEGIRRQQCFVWIGNKMLERIKTKRGVVLLLVFLCFFSSMWITNDVALIVFVPFGISLLEKVGQRGVIPYVIVFMTIASNLGSMATPIGNPQNIYLFSISGISIGHFFLVVSPYVFISGVLLLVGILCKYYKKESIKQEREKIKIEEKWKVIVYFLLFFLALGTLIFDFSYLLLGCIVIGIFFLVEKEVLKQIDYHLLCTFFFFFLFVGNVSRFQAFYSFMEQNIKGNEVIASILLSQMISNVPATMVLSQYVKQVEPLLIGVNLGGLGTLVASMASLISYKQLVNRYPEKKKEYLILFTKWNIFFLIVLYGAFILLFD